MRMLDPGGTGGGSGGGDDVDAGDVTDIVNEDIDDGSDSDAADELEQRDRGSGGGSGDDSGDIDDAREELTDRDQGSDDDGAATDDAREELTDRDEGSGDGSSGSQDRSIDEGITSGDGDTTTDGGGGEGGEDDSDAEETLTERDQGSGNGGGETTPSEELTAQDPGSESRPDELSQESPSGGDAGLLEQAQEEGLEAFERGGAFSEAGRNLTADAAGIAFQNPEDSFLAGSVLSERRLEQRNTDISGPAITAIDFDREGAQSLELEYGERGEINEDVVTGLTSGGGFLTEGQRSDIQEDIEQRREVFGLGDEAASAAESAGASDFQVGVARGAGRLTGDAASLTAQATLGADTAVEVGRNLPGTVESEGAGSVAATSVQVAGRTVGNITRGAQENPGEFTGSLVGGAVGGAAAGRVAGGATRFGRDRVRTAGAETFDIEDGGIVNPGTGSFYNPRSSNRNPDDRFPGAQDPDRFESDPPAAVREQAEDFTPESVDRRFEEAGVEGGTTLKKAIDTEPDDGPGRGFRTQEGSFESPGAFVGPELSPNFFRTGGERSFSLRPGLPDTGDSATGVFVRTRVDRPNAENLDEFNEELLERAGERTARTKPASEVNTGEIEAVIPPEAEFADLGGGPVRTAARRAGVGSDFAVRIGGRRLPGTDRKVGGRKIPIRPVADPDLVDSGRTRGFGDFLQSERGQLGADDASGPRTRTLGEIRRPTRAPTDRPLPVVPTTPTANETSGTESNTSPVDKSSSTSPVFGSSGVPSGPVGSGSGSGGSTGTGSAPGGGSGSPGGSGGPGGFSGLGGSGGGGSGGGGSGGGGSSAAASSTPAPVITQPSQSNPATNELSLSSDTKDSRNLMAGDVFEERFEFGIASADDVLDG